MAENLLDRAKEVAQRITDRVRRALGPLTFPPARPFRVLCVDDVPDAADALAAVLELLGCEARACYGGAAALEIVPGYRPDACFLDLSMPGMDGLELATRLRSAAGCRPLLLVAVTALGSLEDQVRTAVTGFHYHLVKPADAATLRSALDHFRTMLVTAPAETVPPERAFPQDEPLFAEDSQVR